MKNVWTRMGQRKWVLINALLTVVLLVLLGTRLQDSRSGQDGQIAPKTIITLGPATAYAAGSVDYTYGAVNANVQFQAALNALPATGGRLVVVSSGNVNFAALANVTRAIDDVVIEGAGNGTIFVGDGVTPIFTAGGNNWRFINFRTNASGLSMGATTGWSWANVNDGVTAYDYRNPSYSVVSGALIASSITDSGLTSGRIPYASVGGLLADGTNLRWDTATSTFITSTANITTLNAANVLHGVEQLVTVGPVSSNFTTLTAALAAITPTATHPYMITVTGNVTEPGTVVWKSYVRQVNGNGFSVSIPASANGAMDFNNVTNIKIDNIEIHSTSAAAGTDSALYFRGTTDNTVEIWRSKVYLDALTSTDAVVWLADSADPKLYYNGIWGHAGNVDGVRGIYTGDNSSGHFEGNDVHAGTGTGTSKIGIDIGGTGDGNAKAAVLINNNTYGSPNGTSTSRGMYIETSGTTPPATDGNTVPIRVIGGYNQGGGGTLGQGITIGRRSKVIGQGGIHKGGTGAGPSVEGMVWEDNANVTWTGGEVFAGTGADATAHPGFGAAGSASGALNGTIIHQGEFATSGYGINTYGTPAVVFNNVTVKPNEHSYIWVYDDVNNGRFQPGAPISSLHPYQLVSINIDVINANVGVTANISTTIGGGEVASGISIAAVGTQYFSANTNYTIAAGSYLYVSTSAPIADGDLRVEFNVTTDYTSSYAWYNNENGGRSSFYGGSLTSARNSDTIYIVNVTPLNWKVVGTTIETRGTARSEINGAAAVGAPFYSVTLIPNLHVDAQSVLGFTTYNAGTATITSGNTFVTVTHNLGRTPRAAEIFPVVTGWGNATRIFLSSIGSTTFRINTDVDPGVNSANVSYTIRVGS